MYAFTSAGVIGVGKVGVAQLRGRAQQAGHLASVAGSIYYRYLRWLYEDAMFESAFNDLWMTCERAS